MADLDLTAIEAAVHAPGVWKAPWTARTFAIECPCPNGVHCGEPHTCEEVEALEEYPCGEPGAPAEPGAGQCVLWIDVPGLETFAGPTAAAIVALRNNADALIEAARERDRLRALLAAYGRAVEETARVRRDPDRYLDAAAAECEAERAVRAEAAKWREWVPTEENMSEFHVEVVCVGPVTKHPNADTLSITNIHGGYPVIMRTGEYAEGDLAVYVPVDALVPADDPRWEFLGVNTRIKAKRLRGVFSMGLLTKADPSWTLGQDVREELRITKWEADAPEEGSADEADPGTMPVYTDIEGLRRHRHALIEGEEVILTEKIHGENFRAMHDGERLWVGSRTRVKKRDPKASNWWRAAIAAGLEDTLRAYPGVIIYGESCGYTGGFPYGQAGRVPTLRVFDAMDSRARRYFDADDFYALASGLHLTVAPPLYRGPWSWDLVSHADGMSTVDPTHIREGFVVRPVKERVDERLGRVILKMHGEAFLTRGKAT